MEIAMSSGSCSLKMSINLFGSTEFHFNIAGKFNAMLSGVALAAMKVSKDNQMPC